MNSLSERSSDADRIHFSKSEVAELLKCLTRGMRNGKFSKYQWKQFIEWAKDARLQEDPKLARVLKGELDAYFNHRGALHFRERIRAA
jgi:hypothetical protein